MDYVCLSINLNVFSKKNEFKWIEIEILYIILNWGILNLALNGAKHCWIQKDW